MRLVQRTERECVGGPYRGRCRGRVTSRLMGVWGAIALLALVAAACAGADDDPASVDSQAAAVAASQPEQAQSSVDEGSAPDDGEAESSAEAASGDKPSQDQAQEKTQTETGDEGADAAPSQTAPSQTAPASSVAAPTPPGELVVDVFPVPAGSRPHDVAPAADGGVWYTAQGAAALGWLDPATGETRHIGLGAESRPHGVIVGPAGAAWVTDGGLNAIVRVDPSTDAVEVYPLPVDRPNANLNTAAFDGDGRLWFTGQNGILGRLDPATGVMEVFDAPLGPGPYGIAATPSGDLYFASLAGSYVGRINRATGAVVMLQPRTAGQGARRVWSDSAGRIWVSEWNAGQLARFDPASEAWTEWALPGPGAQAYAVFVDETDIVWVSDFGGNAIHRFDPLLETFTTFPLPGQPGNVRQILGRPGEVWAPESAADRLIVIRRGPGPS